MHVLVIAATSLEIQAAIDYFKDQQKKSSFHTIAFLMTGVGPVATAYALTKELIKNKPDVALQAGIAGSFKKNNLVETVIIEEEKFADLGVMENGSFKNIFDLQLAGENEFPFTNGSLVNPFKNLLNISPLQKVRAITINEITTNKERIEWYQLNNMPAIESMEGAAFHYVCLNENIPFMQIRSISNQIGERDKSKWKLKEAVTALNEKLIMITEEILKHDETYFRV